MITSEQNYLNDKKAIKTECRGVPVYLHTPGIIGSLLTVRVACPFLNNLLGRPAAAVVGPSLRRCAVLLGLFLVVNIRVLSRGFRGFFRCSRPRGLLLVTPVMVPPASMVTGAVPPVGPPLAGAVLALRCRRRLPCLRLRCGRMLVPGILRLRIFFCHNCQTE